MAHTSTRRFDTLAAASWKSSADTAGNGKHKKPMDIEKIFGENTFGLAEMKARLPKPTYKALLSTIESGTELDRSAWRPRVL